MNPLISVQEFTNQPAENFNIVFCSPPSNSQNSFIPNSYIYYISDDTEEFIKDARSIEFDEEEKTIICYDDGSFNYASKAYWGFKATGVDEVRILIGGLKVCQEIGLELDEGEPPEITKSNHPYLPFNNSVVFTKEEFAKKSVYCQQILRANSLPFNLLDARGNLILQTQLVKNFENHGITFSTGKSTIVHGKSACLLGVLLTFLGEKSVSVVIDDTEGVLAGNKGRASKKRELSFHIMPDGSDVPDSGATRSPKKPDETHYMLPVEDGNETKKPEAGRSNTICCSACSIF
ncbi:unnamed protein product [Blepharisma stoltei]|uniref:Rhodanese domain-containing protein n=1 Tax=Blepharisma stoltei TaxID=1481888 RepID=A0AAU9J3L7_9CILI|nr:unnamed protein product [Blepharisma stoltei]